MALPKNGEQVIKIEESQPVYSQRHLNWLDKKLKEWKAEKEQEKNAKQRRITHVNHFILVYGYDSDKKILNVVDHGYVNSYCFEEKEMSIDELLEANANFKKRFCNGKYSARAIIKRKVRNETVDIILKVFDNDILTKSYNNIEKDLIYLKDNLIKNNAVLQENSDKIIAYLTALKTTRQCFLRAEHCMGNEILSACLTEIISAYAFLLSLFWKMTAQRNFEYGSARADKICRKIDALLENEGQFIDLAGVKL